MGTQGQRYFGH